MGTLAERASASTEYFKRGQSIPGLRVDGMDVLAVLSAVRHGCEYVKSGNGPLVHEYGTYRYAGHSMSDPGIAYRSREELQSNRANDPIVNLRTKLLEWGIMAEGEVKAMDKDVRGIVNHEVAQAERMPAPEPTLKTLFEDIYVPGGGPVQNRGRTVDESIYSSEAS